LIYIENAVCLPIQDVVTYYMTFALSSREPLFFRAYGRLADNAPSCG